MEQFIPIGERIAAQRRRRGMSQAQLAHRLGRSEQWLSNIERGVRPADRYSLLNAVAGELRVPVTELTGEAPRLLRDPSEQHQAVQEIRLALTGHSFLSGLLRPADDGGPCEVEHVESQVRQAWDLIHGVRFGELGRLLPVAIREAEGAARECAGEHRRRALRALAEVYQVTAATMAQLSETDVAWVAADRSVFAAEQAGEPLLAAAGDFRLGHAFLAGGRPEQADRAASLAAEALAPAARDGGGSDVVALWGALSLVAAIAAAQQGNEAGATAAMATAREAAATYAVDGNAFDTEFGPTNVALHAVSVAVELGRSGEALRAAAAVAPEKLSVERRARFLMDVARAHAQARSATQAVRALTQAEQLAPELVRYHALSREMVRDLVRRGRGGLTPELGGLARRMGVTS